MLRIPANTNVYITNKKELESWVKKGARFKTGDILASNPNFFRTDSDGNPKLVWGALANVAIAPMDVTLEDSSLIHDGISEKMASSVTVLVERDFGKNSVITKLVQKGQKVKVGDPLLVFEGSFDEQEVNDLLERIGDELGEEISQAGRNMVKSSVTGEIVDVHILFNHPEEEYTPSVRKLIRENRKSVKNREIKIRKASDGLNTMILPPTEMVDTRKVKISGGSNLDGLRIKIWIKYRAKMHVGDKMTIGTALKSIVGDVVPVEQAPYTIDPKTGEKQIVDVILSPFSPNARMVMDFFFMGLTNKAILGLRSRCKEIWEK